MAVNRYFLQKAEELKPVLTVTEKTLPGTGHELKPGDEELFDFEDHYVGYVTVTVEPVGRHPDAPLHSYVWLAENSAEYEERPEAYKGWIAASWIQREEIHLDVLPARYRFPRRYAFRYIKLKVLPSSGNFTVRVTGISVEAISSADDNTLIPFSGSPSDKRLDQVSVRTLHECMQEVFEDGPKRDRRLWLGDLRLQALANYETYRNNDLVKRCLYLFAGDTFEDGRVANNLFLSPVCEKDEQFMFDYSLFFINTLWDYFEATGDAKTLAELEPTACRQYMLSRECFDERGLVDVRKAGNIFIDWNKLLDKQCSAQGVYIYALKALVRIEKALNKETNELEKEISHKSEAARKHLYDTKKGIFVSGRFRHISYASQIWMVLAGVADGSVLKSIEKRRFAAGIKTPYLYHCYIEALISCGEKERAYEKMREYWGGMLREGADTFWEVYDPKSPKSSPYGGRIIHSYCHAWSCTPTYFLRKYYSEV